MFGGAAPALVPKPVVKKAEDIKTKDELAREAAFAAAKAAKSGATNTSAEVNENGGGGAWKTAKKSRPRGLALKARAMGKNVTVAESKTIVPEFDEEDVAMGGMGNKKKKRL